MKNYAIAKGVLSSFVLGIILNSGFSYEQTGREYIFHVPTEKAGEFRRMLMLELLDTNY